MKFLVTFQTLHAFFYYTLVGKTIITTETVLKKQGIILNLIALDIKKYRSYRHCCDDYSLFKNH